VRDMARCVVGGTRPGMQCVLLYGWSCYNTEHAQPTRAANTHGPHTDVQAEMHAQGEVLLWRASRPEHVRAHASALANGERKKPCPCSQLHTVQGLVNGQGAAS